MSNHDIVITSLDSRYRRFNARAEIIMKHRVYFCHAVTTTTRVLLGVSVFNAADITLDGNEIKYIIRKDSTLFKVLNKIGANLTKDTFVYNNRILEF